VQVAAVKERGEADPIVKRLSGKGYDVYVEAPKGSQKMFRVRIGSFKTRREAQVMASKLQKEEKLKPWVTR
jgi:cell division septation protein DedD